MIKDISKWNTLLSHSFLSSMGFKLVMNSPFENLNRPYYVKNGIILIFNAPITEDNESDFLVGSAEMRCGKYFAVTFRWIKKQKEIIKIYKAITGSKLKKKL